MLTKWFQSSRRDRSAQRAVALLLLSLTFFDLTVIDLFAPELCEGASAIVAATPATTALNAAPRDGQLTTTTDNLNSPQPSIPAAPECFEEDCFCCCAHILPSAYFRLPALPAPLARVAVLTILPLSAPPAVTFRPPRFA